MPRIPLVKNFAEGPLRAFANRERCNVVRLDGGGLELRRDGNVFLSTDPVEFLSSEVVLTEFADEGEASIHVPNRTEASPGASTVAYIQVTDHGQARVTGESATDVPEVGVNTEKFRFPVVPVRCFYQMSLQDERGNDLAQSRQYPVNLVVEKARAATQANSRGTTEFVLLGENSLSVPGFYNDTTIADFPLTTGGWATATAQQIYDDLCEGIRTQKSNTLERRPADTVLLGTTAAEIVRCARRDSVDRTVQEEIEQAFENQGLRIRSSPRLDSVAAGSGDNGLIYPNDPEVLYWELPIVHEELAPQHVGFMTKTFTQARSTSTVLKRPAAVLRITGIN